MNSESIIESALDDFSVSEVYRNRKDIALTIARGFGREGDEKFVKGLLKEIDGQFRCYAGKDTNMRARSGHPGYPPSFEAVTLFPGRMAEMAKTRDLRGTSRVGAPWLDGLPTLNFVSDLGDALSKAVKFEYLKHEIIDNVVSEHGARHLWLWLTKRPERMLEFDRWLADREISWPENLVAATSITSNKSLSRLKPLKQIRAKYRSLSVEPLWEAVEIPLDGIAWVKLGGESGPAAKPFDLAWAYSLRDQCGKAGAAFFMKQLGSRAFENGQQLKLKHRHGGDWDEWPRGLRIRQFPAGFYQPQESPLLVK